MICVDASVAAKWVLDEEYSARARALYAAVSAAREPVLVPPFLTIEVTDSIRKLLARGALEFGSARQLLADFLYLELTVASPAASYQRALQIADTHRLSGVYDAYYVALAEFFACDLWTDDRRLLRALQGRLPFVKWIGDYQQAAPPPATS